jgi:hypothetical protein
MGYKLQRGETARDAARVLLGDGGLFHDLRSHGWDGNPDSGQEGQEFFLEGEAHGPPAKYQLDPRNWEG